MTFQRLCNLITKGELNYYSKPFDILIEPMHSTSQLSYRISVVITEGKVAEIVELEPPLGNPNWEKEWTADYVRDKILKVKQELHSKYTIHG